MSQLDIIIPIRNEANNIPDLLARIDQSLKAAKITYRLICVDDHSTDSSLRLLRKLSSAYPITIHRKQAPPGKASAILEGAELASAEYVAMIDADCQYPPEALPEMYLLAQTSGMVVANRNTPHATAMRRFLHWGYDLFFGRLLLGFNCDVQSGLKLFRREILNHISPADVTPWTIDLALLHTARDLGFTICSVQVKFAPRTGGVSKVSSLQTTFEIGKQALKTRLSKRQVYRIPSESFDTMRGAGIAYKNKRFITHTTLHHHHSAIVTFTRWQKVFILSLLLLLTFGFVKNYLLTGIIFVAILSAIYFIDVVFNLFLILKSLHFPPEIQISNEELSKLNNKSELPIYTILCPLYHEAGVLPEFAKSIDALDWPKNKLDVQLLLEEDDQETILTAKSLNLPAYFRLVVVPHSFPKTKPKACNYGLSHAKGEYLVIYDAEDQPEPDQLKKAYLAFQQVPKTTYCLQAKLNYYNPHHNLLTRLFTAEYSLWFDIMLPGLQSINTTIPLGGTSNHFRTVNLKELQGWDPFNVTEDCDLGVRLFKRGYTTAIIDSYTLEEANSNLGNWLRQRSRWIKGYIQTYLVHMRNPLELAQTQGWHALLFQLVVGGKIAFMLINPFLWLATIAYFALYRFVGPTIEAFYPTSVLYLAVTSLIFGNFLFLYYYMIGCAKHRSWEIIKYVFLVPFYWLAISLAAFKALSQLIFKPHYWEKTHHGLSQKSVTEVETKVTSSFFRDQFGRLGNLAKSNLTGGALLVGATAFGSFFNFLYNAYLARIDISISEFGLISLVGSFMYISQIVISSLSRTVTYRSAFLLGRHKTSAKQFWSFIRRKALFISVIATVLWVILTPFMTILFQAPSYLPFFLFSPFIIISSLAAVDAGFISGNLKFALMAAMTVIEAVSRFIITVIFVQLHAPELIYAAIPLASSVSFFVGYWGARRLPNIIPSTSIDLDTLLYFPKRFFATSILVRLSTIPFLSLDIILAKIYLPAEQAGQYALVSLVGKMVYFIGSLFTQFIAPLVSKAEGEGTNSQSLFYKLLGLATGTSLLAFVAVGVFGRVTGPLLFGSKIIPVVGLLPWYCFAMVAFTVSSNIINYHQLRRQYLFPVVGFLLSIFQVLGLAIFHDDLVTVVSVMFAVSGIYLTAMILLHVFYHEVKDFLHNLLDFFGLFAVEPKPQLLPAGKIKILIFNWRDTRHKWGGGAEVYIHELAKRWVAQGNEVTVFSGNDGHCPNHEKIEGVEIIRHGGLYTVYIWAFLYYILKLRGEFDLVIDSENGIPFFTPLFVSVPKFLLIHHVHQDMFRSRLYFPMDQIGLVLEAKLMPLVYRHQKIITVSESSKGEIIKLGFSQNNISVINPGIDPSHFHTSQKTKYPSFLYLGRIRPQKNVDIAVLAFAKVLEKYPTSKLTIAGWGENLPELRKLVQSLELTHSITFAERVSEPDKIKLLGQSWAMLQPSSFEGWGITVIEANACGTPVIASDVNGLHDSVLDNKTGILVPVKNVEALAQQILNMIKDTNARNLFSQSALAWSHNFDWSVQAKNFLNLLKYSLMNRNKISIKNLPVLAKNQA